jgi:single-stranded-DNA-specific exonuclease
MALKEWKLPHVNESKAQVLAEECGISLLAAEILISRGISTFEQADRFLGADLELEDPFCLIDMDLAVDRIRQALENFEKIVVYGDYDCDGVTSTVLLVSYLSSLGANVSYYIPKRETEGYGMNKEAIAKLASEQVSLIITVDNGISALEEIAYANELGMTVIVTDHHQVGENLPQAYAVINPHRADCPSRFKELAGVGVAFKLITALEEGDYSYTLDQFSDLVAVGTVGDIVPLQEENRLIVMQGLSLLSQTEHIGLAALMEVAHIDPAHLSSQSIAFGLVPRINAAGRMNDAALAAELLLCDDTQQAARLADELDQLNQLRKSKEDGILSDIEQMILDHPDVLYHRVLTFYREGWHPGVIGIVSSRVLERFGKPNLLMTLEDGMLRGSARSVEFFSLYQALSACSSFLTQYGGHTQAAGFSLKQSDFSDFENMLEDYAKKYYKVMPGFSYTIDKEIRAQELTIDHIKSLSVLEPFGAGNQKPVFLLRNAKISGIEPVSEGKHTRLKLIFGGMPMSAIYFGAATEDFFYQPGDVIDLIAQISINPYRGKEYLSVSITDIRPSGFEPVKFFNAKACYEMFRRGEDLSPAVRSRMEPSRDQVAAVYRFVRKHRKINGDLDYLYQRFSASGINYGQYRIILDLLSDVGLIAVSPLLDSITLLDGPDQVDLNSAKTLIKLKNPG